MQKDTKEIRIQYSKTIHSNTMWISQKCTEVHRIFYKIKNFTVKKLHLQPTNSVSDLSAVYTAVKNYSQRN